jgi:peroxiredoxin
VFAQNRIVAANVLLRLTELSAGGKAPDFTVLNAEGEPYNLNRYSGKYLYLFFVQGSGVETTRQIELLTPIFQRYSSHVKFLMVIRKDASTDPKAIEALQRSVPWESAAVDERHAIYTNYQVVSTPYYVLIDPTSYVVAAPALGPVPNGQYETIDKTFFYIKKLLEEGSGQ